ncbi:MAG: hypothetical protein Q4F28_09200 [Eubacteriales bacterium]|nr:hypothetical protein [Eubacteriales bacterium]
MKTVIYLSNLDVSAVVGTGGRGGVTVSRVCRAKAPEKSIINGMVTDREAFDRFLRAFWAEHRLPERGVTLVLGSARAVTKLIRVPNMSRAKLMEYIPREFSGVERTKNPVFTYTKVGRDGNMDRILAGMVDRSFLEPHVNWFQSAGIRLDSIVPGSMADIVMLNHVPGLEHRTFVAQVLDGLSVLSLLYVDGQYFQMVRSRVTGARGTVAFGAECARIIDNQQQFLRVQNVTEPITHVYLLGEFSEQDVEICRESMAQLDGNLRTEQLRNEQIEDFEHIATLLGGLIWNGGSSDLMCQYRQGTDRWKRRKALAELVLPTAITVLVLTAVAGGQAVKWFSYASEAEQQMKVMSSPALSRAAAEYDALDRAVRDRKLREEMVRKTRTAAAGAPVCTSRVRCAVQESAEGLVAAKVTEYDRASGTVRVELSAERAEYVHRFVSRLADRRELFAKVHYDGYAWNGAAGRWETVVELHLAAGGEVMP